MSSGGSASSFFSQAFSAYRLPEALEVNGLQRAEPLAPGVDRLLVEAVLLGHLGGRPLSPPGGP
jgi:hypothetical protein